MAASDVLDQAIEDENLTAQPVDEAADAEIPAAEAQDESADVSPGGGEGADVSTGIDEELLQLSQAYGIQLDASDPKSFVKSMAVSFDRQLQELGRGQQPSQQQTNGQQQAQQQTAAQVGLDLEALLKEHFPEAEIDPALRKGIHTLASKLSEHSGKQVASLKEELNKVVADRLGAVETYLQQQDNERISSQLDGFFSGLGQEWAGEFGAGTVRQMAPQSTQLQARNAVVEDAAALRTAYLVRGQTPPPIETLLKRSLAARYADRQTTIAKKQIAQQLNQRKGAALSRPAAKNGKAIDPKEAALKFSNDWDREHLADL